MRTSFWFIWQVWSLDSVTVTNIRSQIRQMIDDDAREAGNRNSLRMLGGLVRLSFHDCVGEKCDGCINNQNPENAGLGAFIPFPWTWKSIVCAECYMVFVDENFYCCRQVFRCGMLVCGIYFLYPSTVFSQMLASWSHRFGCLYKQNRAIIHYTRSKWSACYYE